MTQLVHRLHIVDLGAIMAMIRNHMSVSLCTMHLCYHSMQLKESRENRHKKSNSTQFAVQPRSFWILTCALAR